MLNSRAPTHPSPRAAYCISLFYLLFFMVKAKSKKLPVCHTNGARAVKKPAIAQNQPELSFLQHLRLLYSSVNPDHHPKRPRCFTSFLSNTPKHNSKVTGCLSKLTRVRYASLKKSSFFFCPKTKRQNKKSIFWSALASMAPNL